MKHILIIFFAILAFAQSSIAMEFYAPGMRTLSIDDHNSDRHLEGFIWHPTELGQNTELDFESKVWVGTQVVKDTHISKGKFPLVVLSHGMYGNAFNQAWLAAALAQRGYIVAAINHPGTSTWSRDKDHAREMWKRPKDISKVIDYLVSSQEYSTHIEPENIFMAGHSLGGFTAALLAGARYDTEKLKTFCTKIPDELVCGVLNRWAIAKTEADRVKMEADLSDDRIKAFVLFDLGGTQSFSNQSLSQIKRPMLIFGAPIMNSGLTLDIESRALFKALPLQKTQYIELATMSHFDFFGLCKKGGYELLKREEPGDEIICNDGGEKRADKHDLIIENVVNVFR